MTQETNVVYRKQNKGIKFLKNLQKDHLNFFVQMMQRDGAYSPYKILNNEVILINDATALKYIFSDNFKNFHKSKYNDVLKPVLGGGIFLSEDDIWWEQRQEAASVFASKNFPEMTEQMVRAAENMFIRWDQKINSNESIDMHAETMWFALDVALRSFFHQERPDIAKGIQENLGNMLREAETRIWSFANLPQKWILKLPKYKKSLGFLNDIVDELIKERQQSGIYPDDLLTRAIKAYEKDPSTRKILQDKVMSYLTSAHETTANAMAWTLYEIAHRPETVKRLQEEVDLFLGEERPTYDSIKELQYTKNVFDEAMRLYPPVWTMSRVALSDDIIPLDDGSGIVAKKGVTLMLSPYVVHRREKYWKNPAAFDPERFTSEEVSKRPKFSYFPFGGGARLCLGFKFSQIEAVIILSMIMQRYNLALIPGQKIQPVPMITLRSMRPMYFRAEHREHKSEHMMKPPKSQSIGEKCPYHSEIKEAV